MWFIKITERNATESYNDIVLQSTSQTWMCCITMQKSWYLFKLQAVWDEQLRDFKTGVMVIWWKIIIMACTVIHSVLLLRKLLFDTPPPFVSFICMMIISILCVCVCSSSMLTSCVLIILHYSYFYRTLNCISSFDKLCTHHLGWLSWVGWLVGLCCLMTPGLSKDIRCHVWPYFYKQVQISRSDIRPHIKWAVSLVILHMITSIFLPALCGYIWVNILTLSPRGGLSWEKLSWEKCDIGNWHFLTISYWLLTGQSFQ